VENGENKISPEGSSPIAGSSGEGKQALVSEAAQETIAPVTGSKSGAGKKTITDVMGFAGAAPEIVNGRLAMVGFIAALGAELATNASVVQQLEQEPTLINLTFLILISASLVPLFAGRKDKLGPFTPAAEMINGRAAMLGFAALLVYEGVSGSALF
jgi:hypothetical protein